MGFFDINYDILRAQLLPVRLRNVKMKAWLRCLIAPIKWLHVQFLRQRKGDVYTLAHTGQVVFLEAVLNDTFDTVMRGITIVDGSYEDPAFVFTEPETYPVWLGLSAESGVAAFDTPVTLFTTTETTLLGDSFIIRVPASVVFDEVHMRAVVNKYRIAGKGVYGIVVF
ncbi:MAG: hypothetical protein JNM41_15805 [Flavipsychrobacter sp.]|nr:hypothetical protein [Flavipsychrobacter sp.]